MMAYALSSKRLRYANAINFYVFFTMLFGGGLIPWYIVVTRILLLRNSIWAMIIPYLVNPWFMFLLRNYFRSVPESLMESARIDGAGDLRILFRIVLPLSGPALATIGLFYALLFWNDWWLSMLLIDRERLYPLQFLLRALLSNLMNVATSLNPQMKTIQVVPAYSVRMATVVVTIGPIIMLYPFLQRYFVKGITVGAIKG
jgi:ABC-type glycerol-3-phosphate transport system permease component